MIAFLTLTLAVLSGHAAHAEAFTPRKQILDNLGSAYDQMQTFAARSLRDPGRMCSGKRAHLYELQDAMKRLEAGVIVLGSAQVDSEQLPLREELRGNVAALRLSYKSAIAHCAPRDWAAEGAGQEWADTMAALKRLRGYSFKGERLVGQSREAEVAKVEPAKIEEAVVQEKQPTPTVLDTGPVLINGKPTTIFAPPAE